MKLCEVMLLEKSTSQFKFSSKGTLYNVQQCYTTIPAGSKSPFLEKKMAFHNLQLQSLCGLFIWQFERLFGIIYGTSKRFHNTFCVHLFCAIFGFFFKSAAQNIRTASSRVESCWRRRNIKTCKVDTAWNIVTKYTSLFIFPHIISVKKNIQLPVIARTARTFNYFCIIFIHHNITNFLIWCSSHICSIYIF